MYAYVYIQMQLYTGVPAGRKSGGSPSESPLFKRCIYFIYVYGYFAHMYACVLCVVPGARGGQERTFGPWTWRTRVMRWSEVSNGHAGTRVLGTKPAISARTTSALKP